MEQILKKLSQYQIEAYKKGARFSIDLYGNNSEDSEVKVTVSYQSVTPELAEQQLMNLTFTPKTLPPTVTRNLDKIEKFIQNISVDLD